MSVHYKFKSNVAYDTVTFDGLHISVGDLKKAILQQKKIGKSSDFDLQITNAQTKDVFSADDDLVPKNTSVIVARVPVSNPVKKSWERSDTNSLMQGNDSSSNVAFDKLAKTADLVNANATEEEKIKAMMTQSAHEYDPSKYVKSRSMTGPLPANYVCYRCGLSGHWIKSCPTNNVEIKRSTGIPRSFMVTVDGPEIKGALLTSSGDFAVPLIDQQAYKTIKKEKPPFLKEAEVPPEPEPQLPEDLLCMYCKDLLQDAVLIPCCGNSFCDECVRQALLDSENHECPICHETEISPDTLIPNRFQRNAVRNFKNETGYICRTKRSVLPEPVPATPGKSSPRPEPSSSISAADALPETIVTSDSSVVPPEDSSEKPATDVPPAAVSGELENTLEKILDEKADAEPETRAATPLADEPVVEFKDSFNVSPHHRIRSYEGRRRNSYDYHSPPHDSEPSTISTITTRVATAQVRKPYWKQYESYPQREYRERDYSSSYRSSSSDYSQRPYNRNYSGTGSGSYRYPPRGSARGSRSFTRYGSPPPGHSGSRYSSPPAVAPSHRSSHLPPTVNIHQPPPAIHAEHPSYHTEPSPPGTDSRSHPPSTRPEPPPHHEPVPPHQELPPPRREPLLPEPTSHHEPPPPGVGPILPLPPPVPVPIPPSLPVPTPTPVPTTVSSTTEPAAPTYHDNYSRHLEVYRQSNAYHNSRRNKDKKWSKDPMDDFARELMEFDRERRTNPTRRSRSRSYHSSKSWSHSRSRSYSISRSRSRSRSHTYSTRSRSRSFSRSRSRSRTLIRSFSRSRSHSRSIHSASRSPRRKYRPSPHRYYRSRSRSPPRHYKDPPKPYHKRPELHSPSYYSQTTFVPTYPQNIPSNPPHADPYPSDRGGYYDHFHMGYEGYSSHRENRRYDMNVPPPEGRYPPHLDKYADSRKFFGRGHDRRVVLRKDGRAIGRSETGGSYTSDKYKDRALDQPGHSGSRKDEKTERTSHHHKHRESKKPHEPVKKSKETKVKSETSADAGQSAATAKDVKVKKTSKGERHGKEHKHKHRKVKEGEEHKKKKKQKSSDETSQLTGSESDKPKKKKKKKVVAKMKQIVEEVPEKTEVVEEVKEEELLETQMVVGDIEVAEEVVVAVSEPEVVVKDEQVGSESPEQNEGELTPSVASEEKNDRVDVEEEVNVSVEKEEVSSEVDPIPEQEFTEIKDEILTQNESFSGEELPPGSGEESDVAEESANDSILKVSLPEISKWERDDSEEAESEDEPSSPLRDRGEVDEASKLSLTSDIIQKAENAILQKAPKLQTSGEGQSAHDKSSDHSDTSPERKGSESPEAKHEEAVEARAKIEKKDVVVRIIGSESPRKKDESRIISLRKEPVRKDWEHNRRDKTSFDSRTVRLSNFRADMDSRDVRLGFREWERDRPGSRNSSGSLHSSESRRRSGSRAHVIHERSRERQRHDRREVIIRPPHRSSSSRVATEITSRRREPANESSTASDSKSARQRKPSRDHHHDESNFEPNYDGTSDSDGSAASNTEQSKVTKRRVCLKNELLPSKHSHSSKSTRAEAATSKQDKKPAKKQSRKSSEESDSAGDAVSKKQAEQEAPKESRKRAKEEKSESVSSSSSGSESETSETEASPKKKSKMDSTDREQKQKQKKSKHKKHKKHKRKHKKRKSSRKERDEVRVMSSVVRR